MVDEALEGLAGLVDLHQRDVRRSLLVVRRVHVPRPLPVAQLRQGVQRRIDLSYLGQAHRPLDEHLRDSAKNWRAMTGERVGGGLAHSR